jgi:hypothetical protein
MSVIPTLPILTPAEFEQLARDVFALVQRDRTEADIDVAALTGKALSEAEQVEIKDLLGLYFAEVATRAVDAQTAPRPLSTVEMRQWMHEHLRPAA